MLRYHEVETWVLELVRQIEAGEPIEDDRVELKAEWIDAQKAARRIAGHANAARGAPILWVVGLDEKQGVVGAREHDLAAWHSQVQSHFNELSPKLSMSLNVPVEGTTVVALLFETVRAPYVVKNPAYGQSGEGPVELEVPWRQGTSIRSAKRADLLMLLSPLQILPEFEVLSGYLEARTEAADDPDLYWDLKLHLYALTNSEKRICIPFHKCCVQLNIPGYLDQIENSLSLQPPRETSLWRIINQNNPPPSRTEGLRSMTIDATSEELIMWGPGKLSLSSKFTTPLMKLEGISEAEINATLHVIEAPHDISISLTMTKCESEGRKVHRWEVKGQA